MKNPTNFDLLLLTWELFELLHNQEKSYLFNSICSQAIREVLETLYSF